MNYIPAGFAVTLILALSVSCGSDRGDPLTSNINEFGGRLTQGTGRANLTVTESNKFAACQKLIPQVFSAFDGSLTALAGSPDTGSARIVRMPGRFYGYAEVSGSTAMHADNRGRDFAMDLTFYDYSDSGGVFFGGQVRSLGYARTVGGTLSIRQLIFDGGMAFAGDFSGSIMFDSLLVPLKSDGLPFDVFTEYCDMQGVPHNGSLILKSGDNTLLFNPWYRVPVICED